MVMVKSIEHKANITTIKIIRSTNKNEELISRELNAVYALLGGYNEVARNVDLNYFHELQEKFNAIVSDLSYSMAVSPKA